MLQEIPQAMQTHPAVTSLTAFDWFLVLIIVISTAAAFSKGFIRVLLSLGGLIAGIIIASWNYLSVANHLHRWITSFAASEVVAFLLILVLVMVLFAWIAKILRKTAKAIGLGFVDRLLGAAFGVVRGLLLGVAAMMAVTAFFPDSPWVQNSRLAPYFLAGVHAVSFVVPEHFQDQISSGAKYLLHETPELFRPHTLTQHM
jgi:membrane protein required for colicin V production